jgi:hypothetical protein
MLPIAYPGKYWYEYPNNMWQLVTFETIEVPYSQCKFSMKRFDIVRFDTYGIYNNIPERECWEAQSNQHTLLITPTHGTLGTRYVSWS